MDRTSVIALLLTLIFAIHATVFLRSYLRNRRSIYFLVTFGGFVLLTVFYAARATASFVELDYPAWFGCLRWCGIALCAVSVPFLVARLYARLRQKRYPGAAG